MRIVTADIGGTNARFALAEVEAGAAPILSESRRYSAADFSSLAAVWERFARDVGSDLPKAAALAVAAPLGGDAIKFTNSPWSLRVAGLAEGLGVERLTLVNDFGAMAHAVDRMDGAHLQPVAGPGRALPEQGTVTVIGPGTGLGVAQLHRSGGESHIVETEGGHIDFAPLDPLEAQILDRLRARYLRVSVERIVSGPGLVNIYEALAAIEGGEARMGDDSAIWARALAGEDRLASAALDRLCMSFGAVAGDLALAHGSNTVVITGGLANRMADRLRRGDFAERFASKGRYRGRMEDIAVLLCTHPEPGLFGAAVAFARQHLR